MLFSTNVFPDTPIPFPLSLIRVPLIGRIAGLALFSRPSLRMMYRRGSRRRLDSSAGIGDRKQSKAIGLIFGASLRHLAELYGPIAATLAQVRVPTVVIWGDHDPFFSVQEGRRTAAAIAGATLQVLDDCGHFVPEERPEVVADVIRSLFGAHGPLGPLDERPTHNG